MSLRLRVLVGTMAWALIPGCLAVAQTTGQRPRTAPAQPAPPAAHTGTSPYDLRFPAMHAVEIPKAAAFTLSNGMKLLLLEDHELPVIRGEARVRTGNLFDPADKVGLAALTAVVLRSGGTKEMTGDQLDRKLEDMGARVDAAIGESHGEVSFFSLAENTADVLPVLHDVLTGPVFRGDQVELARMQLDNAITHSNDDAKMVAAREFRKLVYGEGSPYGWIADRESINRIRRSDLVAFYKRYFFPKNITLSISGDFETAKLKDQLEQLFGSWNVEQAPVPEFPKVAARPAPGIYFAKSNDVPATYVSIGYLGGQRNEKDYAALTLMVNILGGGNLGRLAQEVRGRMGNAFAISAAWSAEYDHPGLFEISATLKPISTVSSVQAILKEVERMRTAEVTEEELRAAKDRAVNSLVFAYDTRRKALEGALTLAYFGYPEDFTQQHQKALAAVTRADVERVARQYLRPADLTIVVVGNSGGFVPALETMGTVHEIDLTIAAPKLQAAPSDTASLEQGTQILARIQQAIGGADKLAAVKDYTVVRDVHLSAQAGGVNMVETEKWMAPGNIREESDVAGTITVLYSDGRSGWVARGRNSNSLRGSQLKSVQDDAFRSYFALLLSDKVPGRTVNALDTDVIEITTAEGQVVQVTVNPETGLPLEFSYQQPATSGPPLKMTETFPKFGDAGGVKVPYEIITRQNGADFAHSVVKNFKLNSGLVLTDLERRP